MKHPTRGINSLLFALLMAIGSSAHAQSLTFTAQSVDVELWLYSPDIVRVVKRPAGQATPKQSLSVIAEPQEVECRTTTDGPLTTLSTDSLDIVVNTLTGGITFRGKDGRVLLREKDNGTQFTPVLDAGQPSYEVRTAFLLDRDEVVYGLGQQQSGLVSQRGQKLLLRNENMKICIPFVHSAKGYGLFWDNYSPTTFRDNPQEMSFESEVGLCADYYFIRGGNADGVIAGIRLLTGQAPMYPLWALGFWQSRERYKSPDELCDVLDRYRELQIPIDGMVQDWQYWGCDSNWNAMRFQSPLFVDDDQVTGHLRYRPKDISEEQLTERLRQRTIRNAQDMIDHVHQQNAHIMISVWASFGPWTDMYHRMDSIGALIPFTTWPMHAGVKVYDPFNPTARDLYWEGIRPIFDMGMDAWWLDCTEPDHFNARSEDYDFLTPLGSYRSVHNAFPLLTNMGVYEHQRALSSDKRVFLLTRSSFLGQQRYASHSWSGDVPSTWQTMRNQLAAGLNYALCGIPYWNTDIGGFFAWPYGNDVNNPAYRELHVRWFQWGVFQPIMRSHNSSPVAVEIFQFGQPGDWAFDAIAQATRLRYRLLPYLYSTTWEVTSQAGTILRPFVMDFADDPAALNVGNEYLFGHSFLVRPVTDPLYTRLDDDRQGFLTQGDPGRLTPEQVGTTDVYLPAGADWIDFHTGRTLTGGQTVSRPTPIDLMPLYVRAGSIVPWGPDVQYAQEKPWDELTLRIYPGADADFTLYEDEFDNYNYESGAYTTIPMHWDDASQTLSIGARQGSYKGMLRKRTFRVVLVAPGHGVGQDDADADRELTYRGKAVEVKL